MSTEKLVIDKQLCCSSHVKKKQQADSQPLSVVHALIFPRRQGEQWNDHHISHQMAIPSSRSAPDAAKPQTLSPEPKNAKCVRRTCWVCSGWAYSVEQVGSRTADGKKNNIMEKGRFYGYDEGDE